MPPSLFPDNSLILNFSYVDRLDLLHQYLGDNGSVTQAVAHEISASVAHTPNLHKLDQTGWFGDAIEIVGEHHTLAVQKIRRLIFDGTQREPLKHLGESETLYLLKEFAEFQGSIWLTEDLEAYEFAERQGIISRDSFAVLDELVGRLEIQSDEAFAVCQQILEAGRPLRRVPSSPRDFCR